ncbi:hypothetical protein E2320_009424 [Naja naja]|nr:hypothetical protein E2320_009424 [Naja naja]
MTSGVLGGRSVALMVAWLSARILSKLWFQLPSRSPVSPAAPLGVSPPVLTRVLPLMSEEEGLRGSTSSSKVAFQRECAGEASLGGRNSVPTKGLLQSEVQEGHRASATLKGSTQTV